MDEAPKHIVSDMSCTDKEANGLEAEKFRIKRTIGLFNGIVVTAGIIIGSGIFISPNGVLKAANGSVGVSLLIWIFGGVVAFLSSLCYSELCTAIPESGGDFVYFNIAYGAPVGFLVPWMNTFVPTGQTLNNLLLARYAWEGVLGSNCELSDVSVKLTALFFIYAVAYLNYVSVKASLRLQTLFTTSKFAAILAVIVGACLSLAKGGDVAKDNFGNAFDSETLSGISFLQLSSGFYQVMWSYDGWTAICFLTEEVKDAKKNMLKITLFSLVIVTISYVLLNTAYLCVLTPDEMIRSSTVASTFSSKVFGNVYWFVPLTICLCLAGSNNGSVLSYGRITYAASRRGHLPKIFGMFHISNNTPATALMLNAVMISIVTFFGNIDALMDAYGFVNWTFYGLSAAAVIVLRINRPDLERPFKVFLIVPVLVVIISITFVILQFVLNPHFLYLYAAAFFIFGSVLFQLFVQKKIFRPNLSRITDIMQKIFQVAPVDWIKTE